VIIVVSDKGVLDFVHFHGLSSIPRPFTGLALALVFVKVILEEVPLAVPTIIIVVIVVVLIIVVTIVVLSIVCVPTSVIVVVPVVIIVAVAILTIAVAIAIILIAMAGNVGIVVSPVTIATSSRLLIVGIHWSFSVSSLLSTNVPSFLVCVERKEASADGT
jgi:hypothetical protein